jgi:haloalkane dehalogenase
MEVGILPWFHGVRSPVFGTCVNGPFLFNPAFRLAMTLHEYPFTPKSLAISGGHRMAYLDEGSGPAVVMVHGNPSWSYLYRNLVSELKDAHRCIVPDHIGCGLSDKPQDYPYRLRNHIENLEFLLDHLGIKKCVLIVHDWGGAIGMGWAGAHPERVAGLVVFNTAAFASSRLPLRIAVCRLPLIGEVIVRGLNGFARPAIFMAVHNRMRPEVAAGFLHPYDSWKNRVAVHGFVRDIPMDNSHPSYQTLKRVEKSLSVLQDKPMLICWGGEDFCFNDSFFEEWKRRFPAADSHYFSKAGHYVLEDAFAEISFLMHPFLARCDD